MKFNKDEVCILIPTLNESLTVGPVIKDFRSLGYTHILVIDGRSSDNTVKNAREAGALVRTQSGKGKGNAIIEAFEVIEQPYILMLDGDGTYSAKDAEKMLTPLFLGFDQVIGDRLINAEEGSFSHLNLFGNHMLNLFFKLAHSRDLHDILSGYRAFTKLSIQQMNLKETGFEIETEMSVEAVRNGQRIMVVPIRYRAVREPRQNSPPSMTESGSLPRSTASPGSTTRSSILASWACLRPCLGFLPVFMSCWNGFAMSNISR